MKFIHLGLGLFIIASSFLGLFLNNYMKESQTIKLPQAYSPNPNAHLQVKGSIPYWDQENAFKSVEKNPEAFNYLNLFWYFLTGEGNIEKYQYAAEDKKIIDFAHANNIKVFATITNLPEKGDWDSKRVENVLNNETLRKKHILDLLQKLNDLNFDGLIIDYESVNSSQRNQFSNFITELTSALHSEDKLLTVALHPKNSARDEKNGIGAFQDWKALSKSADHLNIMAYGENYDESEAGPIASIPWLTRILNYAFSLEVPPEKLYLGVPLYGYDWDKENDESATGLTYADISNLQKKYSIQEKWDEKSKAPYFSYEEDGDEHEVWFENAKSVEEKMNLAKQAGLAGVTFWRLGGEDPEVWNILKNSK